MAIQAILDTLEGVDEKYHDLYTQKNGKYELTGVEGYKTQADIDRINAGLVKERNDHSKTREKYSVFADLDITDVRSKLDRYPELEAAAAGKLDETAINKLVEGRLNTVTAPLKRENDKYKTDLSERDAKLQQYEARERQRTISESVTKAALKLKVKESAIEDAIMFGERSFEIDEQGNIITKDGIGITPGVSAEVWLTDMQVKKPHWFGDSVGGGAGGSGGAGSTGSNPWNEATWNMTEQGKIYTANPTKAEQLAKSAGTTIGGAKPAKRN